jgi:hypothetical protein
MTKILKQTVRELTKKSRLPSHFSMYISGCFLYDLFKMNNLQATLMHRAYWVEYHSLNSNWAAITWEGR